jgi:hypothetical protein
MIAVGWDQTAMWHCTMPDFRGCKSDLRSSGMLRVVDWYLFTDVSGKVTDHNFNGEGWPLKVSPKGCPETLVNK